MPFRLSIIVLSVFILGGCSSMSFTPEQMKTTTGARAASAIAAFEASGKASASVQELSGTPPDFTRTEAPRVLGDITLRAASAPFAPILSELGRQIGYSVAYAEGVDATRKVTVEFNQAVTEEAIRTTAFLAGYAAVIDKKQRTIMVADLATYTFRLPSSVFASLNATYTVGGSPSSSGGGGGAGGSSGGSSLKADFSISGKEGTNGPGLTRFLSDIAGKNAEVYVSETGHISVRANAQSLRRVHEFLKGFSREAMTQIEIEASVIEVTLAKEFTMGIQWGKVLDRASGTAYGAATNGSSAFLAAAANGTGQALLQTAASMGSSGGMSTFRVSNSSASLINALAQFTEVNIVSQPKLLSMNNVPATFFDGTQLPYLGSVQQTAGTGVGAEPTVTGTVAFAIDGVSFSAIPSVVDSKTVQISLIPVLSTVQGFDEFLGGTLKAPRQGNKQTYMRVLAESGKTLILGGIRYNKDSKETMLPSSLSNGSTSKEVVILLRANVIAPPDFDPIVSETL
jgi:MSHA biogenesis protein MshL